MTQALSIDRLSFAGYSIVGENLDDKYSISPYRQQFVNKTPAQNLKDTNRRYKKSYVGARGKHTSRSNCNKETEEENVICLEASTEQHCSSRGIQEKYQGIHYQFFNTKSGQST